MRDGGFYAILRCAEQFLTNESQMKNKFFGALAVVSLLLSGFQAHPADTNSALADLNDLIGRINLKLQAGQHSEADLADNIKEFDVLLAKHKGQDPNDLALIPAMKANLYLQVLHNDDKAIETIQQLQHDFPGTERARNSESVLAQLQKMSEADRIQRSLVEQTKFPDFSEQDLDGKPLSIASYKGKVVLIDFWATWCSPCRAEIPNVVKTYQKYHDKGFEVIGVSLDKADDKDALIRFAKENNMPWRQYFDGQFWTNKLAAKYGVTAIPMTYLLDGDGKIIARNIRGEELDAAVAKALGGR